MRIIHRFLKISLPLWFSFSLSAQVVKTDNGVLLKNIVGSAQTVQIKVLADNIVRITASPTNEFSNRNNLSFTSAFNTPSFSLNIGNDYVTLKTFKLNILIDRKSANIMFRNNEKWHLLTEGNRFYKPYKNFSDNSWSIKQEFKWGINENLFQAGQNKDVKRNMRGSELEIINKISDEYTPLILSSKGYGILWDNKSNVYFLDTDTSSYLGSREADQIDYYFIYGPSENDVILSYCKLTGKSITEFNYAQSN
jgi:alpha-D-xyloside xylohydrolase